MRKFIFSSVMLLLCSGLFAQNATAAKNKQLSKALHKMSDVSYLYQDAEIGSPIAGPVNTSAFYMAKTRVAGTTVGTSTYGLGSNGSPASRLIAYTDGKISAVFTGSSDGSSAYADRGTWYNYYDGSTWGAEPTERIESIRTGFGQLILVGTEALGAEMTFAHTGSNTIKIYASVPQSNVWTEMPAS
ncbi:MAG: hypothetical protein H7X71_06930, partial [Chitinophagales bacterium]|nr:hypothetical protein [Chitinophagales bacterium]